MADTRSVGVLATVRDARRRRTLASDNRAGSWARGRARRAQREFLRETWWLFASFVLITVGAAVGCGFLIPSAYLRGMVVGAALVIAPGAVWMVAMQFTNTAPMMMGDQAEQWTAQELRRLTRREWRLLNHFALRVDDIDHVLIGPGGAYAVETKWCGSSWASEYGVGRLREAVAQSSANGRLLRLWVPFRRNQIPVTSVVVLWGRGLNNWPPQEQIRVVDGVHVVAGPALRRWTDRLGTGVLSPTQIESVWEAMESQASRRDPIDAELNPVPTSLTDWAAHGALAVASACTALVVIGQLLDRTNRWPIVAGAALLLALPALAALRLTSSRLVTWVAWAWMLTIALLGVALLITVAAANL